MADVTIKTLYYAIQAVNSQIKEFEHLLTADILPGQADIQDLTFCYERAMEELKRAYQQELPGVSNYPNYEELVK